MAGKPGPPSMPLRMARSNAKRVFGTAAAPTFAETCSTLTTSPWTTKAASFLPTRTDVSANVKPAVAEDIYRVVAVNAAGSSLPSNPLELTVSPRIEFTGSCSQPGITAVSDPVGDESDGQPTHDITSVSMAEPITNATTGAADNIVFTMKVVNLTTVPPSWRWSVRFNVPGYNPPNAPIVGAQEDWFVSM